MQDQGLSMVEIMGRNKPFTITTFIILCPVMQVTDFKPQKTPITEPFCAALLTLTCPAALNSFCVNLAKHVCMHIHAHKLQSNC